MVRRPPPHIKADLQSLNVPIIMLLLRIKFADQLELEVLYGKENSLNFLPPYQGEGK